MLSVDRGLSSAGLFVILIGVSICIGGCLPEAKVAFDSPAPSKRLDAIAQASQEEDQESRIQLVEKLGSTDPAERMLAIRSLEQREGTTLGYHHAAPHWERLEAIQRWREHIGISDTEAEAEESPMN